MELTEQDFEIIPVRDYLTELDRAVLNNDYDKIIDLISRGSTIYIKDKLCGGYLNRKQKTQHKTCIKNICNKTSVYYAFYINYCIYRHIVYNLKELETRNIIKMPNIEYECCCTSPYKYYNKYDSTYYNYVSIKKTFIILSEIMGTINTNQIIRDKNIKLIDNLLNFLCIYDKPQLSKLDTNILYRNTIILKENYETSTKIISLLLNQQCYEIYKYYLTTKWPDMTGRIDEIYTDVMYDINYVNQCDKKDILLLTLMNGDNDGIVNKLLTKGSRIPSNVNTVLNELLEQEYFKTVTYLLTKIDVQTILSPQNTTHNIINNIKMNITDKINMLDILNNRNALELTSQMIMNVMNNSTSYDILLAISKNSEFNKYIDQSCIMYAIKAIKYNELDILLKHGRKSLIDGEDITNVPIMHYLKTTNKDTSDAINLLQVLLRYDPNLNITDTTGLSPLLISVKDNRKNTVELMVARGADPFYKDPYGSNAIHNAIKDNYYEIIQILAPCKKNGQYLINEIDKYMKSPLILSLDCNDPELAMSIIIKIDGINLDYYDSNGMSILNHIIDSPKLTDVTKYHLINMLITRDINLLEANKIDSKPIVVKAVENNLFHVVVLIMNKLISKGEIQVGDTDIIKSIKNNTLTNIITKDTTRPNFYSLVVLYLKQNIHKLNSLPIKHKVITNQQLTLIESIKTIHDPERVKKHAFIKLLFMMMLLVLGMIEKTSKKIDKSTLLKQ